MPRDRVSVGRFAFVPGAMVEDEVLVVEVLERQGSAAPRRAGLLALTGEAWRELREILAPAPTSGIRCTKGGARAGRQTLTAPLVEHVARRRTT